MRMVSRVAGRNRPCSPRRSAICQRTINSASFTGPLFGCVVEVDTELHQLGAEPPCQLHFLAYAW
jgi:hypothetical protein